jgi:hypothetical protein
MCARGRCVLIVIIWLNDCGHQQAALNSVMNFVCYWPCILSQILVNNQPDALFHVFIYSFHLSACFERQVLIIRDRFALIHHLVWLVCVSDCLVCLRPHASEGEMRSSTPPSSSALDRVRGQRHAPAALPPRKTRYPLYRKLGGPQGRSGRVRKISLAPGFDLRAVRPVENRYTDCATVLPF